ncbi:MAG: hypothetical protein FLDDKLPJ_03537 [Phycisphaerae bacterium]|nr:hypothetical protein [Phycisphaerae bacterium]
MPQIAEKAPQQRPHPAPAAFARDGVGAQAMRVEADDLPRMHAQHGVQIRPGNPGQMRIRAESAVAHDDVAGRPLRVQIGRVLHVMRAQGRQDHIMQEAGLGVEQREQVGDGKSAAGLLPAGLSEVRLMLGSVGHGESRAVEQREAMAVPQCWHVSGTVPRRRHSDFLEALRHRVHPPPDQLQREALPRLTIGRSGESLARKVRQVGHGGVAMNHLQEKQVQRGVRIEGALSPSVPHRLAQPLHRTAFDKMRQVFTHLPQARCHRDHPWPPVLTSCDNTIIAGGLPSRQRA